MSLDSRAKAIAEALGIKYSVALRLKKAVGTEYDGTDLIHACRELNEKWLAELAKPSAKTSKARRVLPKGAGRVNCTSSDKCDATAAADGKGSPIVLIHDDGCPDKYPIKDHAYDVGHDREDGKPCIAIVADQAFWEEDALCGQPLSEHAYSIYPEDGR